MKCDKEKLTKHKAETRLHQTYTSGRRRKMRIYKCPECFFYHLTKEVGRTKSGILEYMAKGNNSQRKEVKKLKKKTC